MYLFLDCRSPPLPNTRALIKFIVNTGDDQQGDADNADLEDEWIQYAIRRIAPAALDYATAQKDGRLAPALELFQAVDQFFNPIMIYTYVHSHYFLHMHIIFVCLVLCFWLFVNGVCKTHEGL